MEIIRKLYELKVSLADLVLIYTPYVRSSMEFNCCVWQYNSNKEESDKIDRVQKVSLRVILKEDYISYENALSTLIIIISHFSRDHQQVQHPPRA